MCAAGSDGVRSRRSARLRTADNARQQSARHDPEGLALLRRVLDLVRQSQLRPDRECCDETKPHAAEQRQANHRFTFHSRSSASRAEGCKAHRSRPKRWSDWAAGRPSPAKLQASVRPRPIGYPRAHSLVDVVACPRVLGGSRRKCPYLPTGRARSRWCRPCSGGSTRQRQSGRPDRRWIVGTEYPAAPHPDWPRLTMGRPASEEPTSATAAIVV
jgi:hypothetical protein